MLQQLLILLSLSEQYPYSSTLPIPPSEHSIEPVFDIVVPEGFSLSRQNARWTEEMWGILKHEYQMVLKSTNGNLCAEETALAVLLTVSNAIGEGMGIEP